MKRLLCLLLLAALLPLSACGEGWDDDFSFSDFLEVEEVGDVTYNGVAWTFPIDLDDLDPDLLVLANKHMFLSKSFVPDLVTVKSRKVNKDGTTNGGVRWAENLTFELQQVCADALAAMCEAAEAEGIKLYLKSAYRSYSKQDTMYSNRLKKYGYDDGYVNKPGASDHQTGLGCDIVSYAWRDKGLTAKFGETTEAKWMAANCADYGFILRYPADKEAVTEIKYEGWHFRYVGKEVAAYIMSNNLCLEEFHTQLLEACDAFIAAGGQPSLVQKFYQESAADKYPKY